MKPTPSPQPETEAAASAAADLNVATVSFASPIRRGATTIPGVTLRRPRPGALRGTNLADLLQMNVDAVAKVIPRISEPTVTEQEVLAMEDAGDFTELATALSGFLLPTRLRADFPTTSTS